MSILISGLQNLVKNCSTYAPTLGLMLISNGEEMPYLLTATGAQVPAGLPVSTFTPTVADGGSGNLTNGQYVVYAFVWVSENTFPLVAAIIYGNPSPISAAYNITGSGNRKTVVTVAGNTNALITSVYIYRTALQSTALLATTAAQAGELNFCGSVANTGASTLTFTDNTLTVTGNDLIQYYNYSVPQFKFSVWDGFYFWGWGNQPFSSVASWSTVGVITLTNTATSQFFGGRNGQFITFSTISTGGIDGRGTFLFKQTGSFTGQATLSNGSNATLPSDTTGTITIVGASATLYRSAYQNPFAWGYLQNIGGSYIPNLWALVVSGAIGTAIAIVPDQQLLKLDMEFPALCLTYALQTADTQVFLQTQRQVSNLYSVTSHFSQFNAVSQGRQVLWGFDYKNLAVIQSDGYTQVPISGNISILLRNLTQQRFLQVACHGLYDPETECNYIWLSSSAADGTNPIASFDICVYQHAPTGYWGVVYDYAILSSAAIENPSTTQRSVLVGTENGFVGQAFDTNTYGNWLPSNSPSQGFINNAGSTWIQRSDGQDDFNPNDAGLIGNFCLITDPWGLNSQICKITNVTNTRLTFSQTLNPIPQAQLDPGLVPVDENGNILQWRFFIGLIEIRMLKYFDTGEPSLDKAPREYWATIQDGGFPTVEFYREHTSTPIKSLILQQDEDGSDDAWKQKFDFPTKKGKTFGIALVERSYNPSRVYNFVLTTGQ